MVYEGFDRVFLDGGVDCVDFVFGVARLGEFAAGV